VSNGDPATGVNMVIRYNTTNGTISAGCVSGSAGCWDVYGNIMGHASYCGGALSTWEYNVTADNSCTGGTNKVGTPSFVGPTPQSSYGSATIPNFHLASNDTVALSAGDPARYPSFDFDSDFRPQGAGPEAGADELATGGTGDTTPPTVSITAPATGATITGTTVTISANASDNVAVAGVTFKVDGNMIGSEDTTSPYSITWNSQTVANGTHSITATARDSSNNSTTSTSVSVTVSNNTIIIGDSNVLTTPDSGNGNILSSMSASLSQTATIQSISFYVTNAAGLVRLGIYDASGPSGGPGALKASTAEITAISGWNTVPVITPVSLSAGTYWLAFLVSDSNLGFVKTTDASSSSRFYNYTYGSLPATFSTTPTSSATHKSLYATLSLSSGSVQGDLNNDSHVNILDLSIMLSHYSASGTAAQGDINNDGTINIVDLSILLSHYGT
jgi:hypothetical protein